MFVRGLPKSTTDESLKKVFSEFGVVRSIKIVKDLFSGECKGFATITMEGHEARNAMNALNNSMLDGSVIRVMPEQKGRKHSRQR